MGVQAHQSRGPRHECAGRYLRPVLLADPHNQGRRDRRPDAFTLAGGTILTAGGIGCLQGTATSWRGAGGRYALTGPTVGMNTPGHFTARGTLEADCNTGVTSEGTCAFRDAGGQAWNGSVELRESASDSHVIHPFSAT